MCHIRTCRVMRSFPVYFFKLKLKVASKDSFLAVAGAISYVPALERSQLYLWIVMRLVYISKRHLHKINAPCSAVGYSWHHRWNATGDNEPRRCQIISSGASLRLWLLAGSRFISPICSESLQAFVSVLSRVDAGGQVEAPPSAAVATASGINPVSRDYTHTHTHH